MRRIVTILTIALAVTALRPYAALAQGTQAPPSQATSATGRLKHFTVTLVLGDPQAGTSDKLTAAETKALADLKDFLPYKKYTALDSVPIIGVNGPWISLQGIDGKHEFYMRSTDLSPRVTQVDMLRLTAALPSQAAALGLKQRSPGLLIDTSFKIEVGETVVVGTSRLDGSQALILLVTAVR
jgi:hypothetical protein